MADDPKMDEIKSKLEDEILSEESDADHDPSFPDEFQPIPLDYWYGKKYFEGILAQKLFEERPIDYTVIEIDSRFEGYIRNFPYSEANQSLRKDISRVFRSDKDLLVYDEYAALLQTAGMITRLGNHEEKGSLMGIIREFMGVKVSNPPQTPRPVPRESSATSSSPPPMGPPRPSVPEYGRNGSNMGYFSSRLKEKADIRGWELNYAIERDPNNPEAFIAQLPLDGRVFIGTGARKTLAKHEASKKACAWLDSRPENRI